MKAKEYLQRITFLDSKIESNKERVKQYKALQNQKANFIDAD